jgi:hypothetical protein
LGAIEAANAIWRCERSANSRRGACKWRFVAAAKEECEMMKRGILLAAAAVVLGCQSPPHRPRILSVQTPGGLPPAPPLNSSPRHPILVPTAPVNPRQAVTVPAVPVVPVVPGAAVGLPEPPPGAAAAPPVVGVGPAPAGGTVAPYPPAAVPANPPATAQPEEIKRRQPQPIGAPSDR